MNEFEVRLKLYAANPWVGATMKTRLSQNICNNLDLYVILNCHSLPIQLGLVEWPYFLQNGITEQKKKELVKSEQFWIQHIFFQLGKKIQRNLKMDKGKNQLNVFLITFIGNGGIIKFGTGGWIPKVPTVLLTPILTLTLISSVILS